MPKVSIITTTYKHEKFISQTIESILNQTFSDWELLIGDDNGPDKTYEVALEYSKKDPRIKVWKHKNNLGIVGNTNFLLSKVSIESEYIAFLEGDDLFIPDNLEKKLGIFNKFPEVGLVYNNLDFINDRGEVIATNILKKAPFYLKNSKLTKEQLIKYETFYVSYSTLMFRKDILLKEKINNPTDDKLYSVSDWDLFFRISTMYNCYGIEDSMTLYRRHAGNLSGQYLKLFNDLEIQITEYLKNGFIDKKLFDYKLAFIYILRAVAYLEIMDRKNSVGCIIKSLKISPLSNLYYKVGILGINILPGFLIKKILNIFIKR
ncbi:MAG: glycosyltransferase [Candidatus Gracilibacteria bacterium]|nr:glycosyltransferase [Candidatus Gracilibacteria bacterium]MDD2908661.1 glycosyltransferase [Candidatus Gracilibacteria bacterium]